MNKTTPRSHQAEVIAKEFLNSAVVKLTLKGYEPFQFIPGQFLSLKVSEENFRSYSICSDNPENAELTLLIKLLDGGLGSTYIRSLEQASTVTFIGPSGKFRLPEKTLTNSSGKLIFVATGSGLAPILAMLDQLEAKQHAGKIHLLFGVRTEAELFCVNEIKSFEENFADFSYTLCLSQDPTSGRVTKYLSELATSNSEVYLCGNPAMISECVDLLKGRGVADETIHYEKFTLVTR
jgi:benzoate/toluate 1,2-dioxygenase reductase component